MSKGAIKFGQRFSLEKAFSIQEKGFKIEEKKTYQINERENLNIFCLQTFNLAPKVDRPRLATRSSIVVAR